MKTMKKLFSMAALALVGATFTGCSSSDDNIIDQPQQPETKSNVVTLTTTVGLDDGGATTRALAADGKKTFAAGETMAIYYSKNEGNDYVKAVSAPLTAGDITNGGKSATFTFTLTNPDKTQSVVYTYPAAMANDDGTVNYDALNSQDGTLTSLAANLDYCTKLGAWDGDNLPSLTLQNQLAILAITLKNETGSSEITSSITGLTLSDGTYSYSVMRSAAAGPIYVAIRPTSSANIGIIATDGTKNYTKTLTGKTYEAGNGYPVSWRMAVTALNITSPSVGQVIGSDGKNYAYGSLPSGVTAVAKICYVSGSNGLALALADEGYMNWSTVQTTCAAHTPAFTGGTWKLASKDEWDNMISDAGSYTDLRDGFSSVGGTNMHSDDLYWSSTETEPDSDYAWIYDFGSGHWGNGYKDFNYYVRACLAF